MSPRILGVAVGLAALCSACDSSVGDLFERSPFDARGPLTAAEIDAFGAKLAASVGADVAACIKKEAVIRAAQAGDPQTLNPLTVDMLPAKDWSGLDTHAKRVILTQVMFNQATAICTRAPQRP